ncbi:hypothetical protein ACIBL3_16020 [Kribbella sp. NPDC050124]|uniref:hypothetical protein n=1 Tax=Kribbella sp. NPDC050124 TaxID=3364114 RepID=UPI0037B6C084
MITVGGVDTYYDYNEQCWKYRRLGGGPIRPSATPGGSKQRPEGGRGASQQERAPDKARDRKAGTRR